MLHLKPAPFRTLSPQQALKVMATSLSTQSAFTKGPWWCHRVSPMLLLDQMLANFFLKSSRENILVFISTTQYCHYTTKP